MNYPHTKRTWCNAAHSNGNTQHYIHPNKLRDPNDRSGERCFITTALFYDPARVYHYFKRKTIIAPRYLLRQLQKIDPGWGNYSSLSSRYTPRACIVIVAIDSGFDDWLFFVGPVDVTPHKSRLDECETEKFVVFFLRRSIESSASKFDRFEACFKLGISGGKF